MFLMTATPEALGNAWIKAAERCRDMADGKFRDIPAVSLPLANLATLYDTWGAVAQGKTPPAAKPIMHMCGIR